MLIEVRLCEVSAADVPLMEGEWPLMGADGR